MNSICGCLLICSLTADASPFVTPVMLREDSQVIQRDAKDHASCVAALPGPIDPAARLSVEIESQSGTSRTAASSIDLEGSTKGVAIPELGVGGPYAIRIVDQNHPDKPLVQFRNVLVGDIWLLGGQSNMFGIDIIKEDLPAIPGVNMFDLQHFSKEAHWRAGKPPIHRIPEPFATFTLKSQHPEYSDDRIREIINSKVPVGGIDGSYFFARKLLAESNVPIGLIPCATGGSLSIWDPKDREQNRYGFLFHHIRSVGGRVKGLLFFQGEQDAIFGDENQTVTKPSLIGPLKTYGDRFVEFVTALRQDVGDSNMPVLYAQVCRHHNGPEGREKSWELIRETQRTIPDRLPNAHCIPTIDLDVMDGLHLDYDSLRRFGERAARLALPYVKPGVPPRTEIRLKSATIASGPRPRIVVEYTGVTGALHGLPRPTGFVLKNLQTGQSLDWIYKVEIDAAKPNVVILHTTGLPNSDIGLYYGAGPAPYANITDEADMPLPAFGPIVVTR